MVPLTQAGYLPLCEVCDQPFQETDLEDGCTIPSECCERNGMCEHCRKEGNHDCE